METIYKKFKEIVEKYGERPAVCWKENSRWLQYNYQEFLSLIDNLAGGLFGLKVNRGERLAILSENRPEWLMADLAINRLGAVSVPIHATANEQLIKYILKDSGSSFLIVSENLFEKHKTLLTNFVNDEESRLAALRPLSGLRKIILISNNPGNYSAQFALFKDLIKAATAELEVAESELASIVYTSGTTGEAKGVMLSNKNFLTNVEAALERIKINEHDKFLSFLPLSHVLERTAGSYVPILSGASIAYAEGIKKLADNLAEVRPTILISVPKIFETMHEKIIANLRAKNFFIRDLFFTSLKRPATSWLRRLADALIYKKIRRLFGGRLRFAVSGGASINERILRFFKNVGVVIIEGYGLTETAPIVAANSLANGKIGTVGQPLSGVEVKIAVDKEILVKGEIVMRGYWQKEELTREVFDQDGWFKTGDLGFLDKENFLTVIGRKKEMIVTSNGKNISPEKIESLINLSPYISQSLVVGHKNSFLAALVVPDREMIKGKFRDEKIDLIKLISEEINKINREAMPHEAIKKFHLLDKPFTVEADELTPTLKARRTVIEARYAKEIDKLYKS